MAVVGTTSALGIAIGTGAKTNKFRAERFRQFREIVDAIIAEKGSCSILDIGGTAGYWQAFGADIPANVTITVANPFGQQPENTERMKFDRTDACAMGYEDNSFDIVHSNSVIEHVGQWRNMAAMATEVRRVARRYFVQTPNFWFPVEPHYRTLFFHWLPEPIRASMLLKKDRGFWKKADNIGRATEQYQAAILLDFRQMAFLFPDAEIRREKFFGFTKSLVAVKA